MINCQVCGASVPEEKKICPKCFSRIKVKQPTKTELYLLEKEKESKEPIVVSKAVEQPKPVLEDKVVVETTIIPKTEEAVVNKQFEEIEVETPIYQEPIKSNEPLVIEEEINEVEVVSIKKRKRPALALVSLIFTTLMMLMVFSSIVGYFDHISRIGLANFVESIELYFTNGTITIDFFLSNAFFGILGITFIIVPFILTLVGYIKRSHKLLLASMILFIFIGFLSISSIQVTVMLLLQDLPSMTQQILNIITSAFYGICLLFQILAFAMMARINKKAKIS